VTATFSFASVVKNAIVETNSPSSTTATLHVTEDAAPEATVVTSMADLLQSERVGVEAALTVDVEAEVSMSGWNSWDIVREVRFRVPCNK
jgi:hypothetical protein